MHTSCVLWAASALFPEGTLLSKAASESTVGVSLLAAAAGFALWFLALLWSGAKEGRFRIQVNIQKQHYIQACCHFCIYLYWGLYWPGVRNYAPLIAAQIVFAYLFEMLLSWSRGRVWQLRLGPFPIVFSINLFMWFREPYFYLQLLMIAFTYLAKEFLTWTWGGRKRHIFNPSGISLSVVGLILLGTGTIGKFTYGIDLTTSFYLPPNLYEVIFLLGLIVMFMFSTTLITLGSFVALWALYSITSLVLLPVDVYVLLGLTFLLTDPSTSPRNNWGKFLFGLAYGILIFITYVILRLLDEPSYFDKLFPVPILNLLAPRFEVLGERVERWLHKPWLPAFRHVWAINLALYVGIFIAALPPCKTPPPGVADPLPAVTERQQSPSAQMTELRVKIRAARSIYPEAFEPFGFPQEIAHFRDLRDFKPRTALEHASFGKALVEVGDEKRALTHFRRALDIDPACAAAHMHLGNVFLFNGKVEAAMEHLGRALALNPRDGNTHFSLGLALNMQHQYDKAIHHLQQAVDLSPSNARACVILGNALILTGRPDEAVPHLRRALAIMPRDREARKLLDFAEARQSQNIKLPTQ